MRVAIDDFGTGYSSLAYLRALPIDVVKVDKAFVQAVRDDRVAEAIVRMVVSVADDLVLVAIAEGVETEDQRLALMEMGYGCAQGYLFSPALEPEELAEWVRARDAGGAIV